MKKRFWRNANLFSLIYLCVSYWVLILKGDCTTRTRTWDVRTELSWPVAAGTNFLIFCWAKRVPVYRNLHNHSGILKNRIMLAKTLLERRRTDYNWILNLLLLGSFLDFFCICVRTYDILQGGIGHILLPPFVHLLGALSWPVLLSLIAYATVGMSL